ncbi:hypothetical protein [Microbulbifer sp. VAAF005]|uniref:hypothetical protein n=1 Tax=Microbulbifer sp. VAAF005 TaxID=3034230 RepID=UPI0024AD8CD0|nr:hypothetical protein [Microbulbifer sp. VAAF005]WHI46727.1 hypothetical protein P0078_24015 [Microbulbifer sp. VAAF005]
MTFKSEILKAVKSKAAQNPEWKFIYNKYYIRPETYCELIIDPKWSFNGSPASVLLQPAAGIYAPEIDEIYCKLSNSSPARGLMFYIQLDHQELGRYRSQRVYAQDFESQDRAVSEVLRSMDCIFTAGENYLSKQFKFNSREAFYASIPERTRGFGCIHYCIARGLLGDTDYIKSVLRKEIDPKGSQDLALVGKILDYFS